MKSPILSAIQALMHHAGELRDKADAMEDNARSVAVAVGENRLAMAIEAWTLSRTASRWARVLAAMDKAKS